MFGHNEIVGRKFFAQEPNYTVQMTSMFFTLQGEGPLRGEPAYFTRFAKCNLACSFCDTFFDKGDRMSFNDVLDRVDKDIRAYFAKQNMEVPSWAQYHDSSVLPSRPPKKRKMALVITGGEPMLQSNITEYCYRMQAHFEKVQIESNGTIVQELPEPTILVCSPKCAEKDGKPTQYLKPNLSMLERANCLKFVMCAPPVNAGETPSPYSTVPDWALAWAEKKGKPVFISPMNVYNSVPHKAKLLRAERQGDSITLEERSTVDEVISFWEPGLLNMEANQRNHEHAAKYALTHGFIFNIQMHLLASMA
jgi:organic radical activating enzyme